MRVAVDKNTNVKTIYIHSGESKPTGAILGGSAIVEEGDTCYEVHTGDVYMFNGTSWVKQ